MTSRTVMLGNYSLADIRALAIDLDGVVYIGDQAIAGAAESIEQLRKAGKTIYFVTNNSGKHRRTVQKKLHDFKIQVMENEIITSAYATADFLKSLSTPESLNTAFLIGSSEFKEELQEIGIDVVQEKKVQYLVVGFDREFTYDKICMSLDILKSGAKFVACNRDRNFPIENDRIMPGCGSMVAAIEYAWGKQPDYEIGKPNTYCLEIISRKTDLCPNQILVVGDTAETDIAMAKHYGSPSVLVSEKHECEITEYIPDLLITTLADLPILINGR